VGTPLPDSSPIPGAVNSRIAFFEGETPKRARNVSYKPATVKIFGQIDWQNSIYNMNAERFSAHFADMTIRLLPFACLC